MKSTIRALLLGSVAGVMVAGAAFAADLRGSLLPQANYSTWSGLYFGVNGGYAWTDEPVVFSTVGIHPSATGGLFGGQVGYNLQWTPDWVVGVEADFDWADISGQTRVYTPFQAAASQRIDFLGTMRGRVGYVLDDVLLYGTAGVAYGKTELGSSATLTFAGACDPLGFCANTASAKWMVGWAAGVGFDWPFLPRWSFRSEYLHYDLGSHTQTLTDTYSLTGSLGVSSNFRGDIVRGAINYKFR